MRRQVKLPFNKSTTPPPPTDQKPGKDPRPGEDKFLSIEEITEILLAKVPDGEVVVIELDKDDKEYEVEMVDDKYIYEFEVDAVNGKILGMEKVKLDDDEEEDD